MEHISVLLKEAIDGLNIKENGIYVDATLGYGGHSSEIHKRLERGFLFAFDRDKRAIDHAKEKFKSSNNITLIYENFANMKEALLKYGVSKVDGIIFDLGLSSPQIDDATRGFSFMQDAMLDMRMDEGQGLNARQVVNEYDYSELVQIFFKYGEERYSKQIAECIIKNRPINTTLELVDVIKKSVPISYYLQHHPERRIFQAIRIEVNDELRTLEYILPIAIDLLNPHGRISVITFHSLEDRITKQVFNKYSKVDDLVKGLPEIPEQFKPKIKLINKHPILPSEEEIKNNPRSKSAKLRIIERL